MLLLQRFFLFTLFVAAIAAATSAGPMSRTLAVAGNAPPPPQPTLGPSPTPKNSPMPGPSPVLTIQPTPLPTPVPTPPATPPPPRSLAYVNGQSVDVSGTDKCPTDNDPPAPPYYSQAFNNGSSYEGYSFAAAAPTSPSTAIAIAVSSSSGLNVQLFGPNPIGGQPTLLRQVQTAGGPAQILYYAGGAPAGIYQVDIGGTIPYSGDDCGKRLAFSSTTTTWTGTAIYSP